MSEHRNIEDMKPEGWLETVVDAVCVAIIYVFVCIISLRK